MHAGLWRAEQRGVGHDAIGAADIGRIVIAFSRSKMKGGSLIDEEAADQSVAVGDDPLPAPVSANREAGRRGVALERIGGRAGRKT
jgi:hypothetical protein